MEFLRNNGISDPIIAKMLSADSNILKRSLEKRIIPSFNYIKSFLRTNDNIAIAFGRSTWIFHNLRKQNIRILQNHGVPDSIISKILMTNPRTLCADSDKFSEAVMKIIEMGFDPSSLMFVRGLWRLLGINKGIWEVKLSVYRSFGWSDAEILSMFRKQPGCMASSEKKISTGLDFFMDKLNFTRADIFKYPTYLFLSLEKRTMPRCSVFEVLLSKGLMKKGNMGKALKVAEDEFMNKYVVKYQEDLPQLLKVYQSKSEQSKDVVRNNLVLDIATQEDMVLNRNNGNTRIWVAKAFGSTRNNDSQTPAKLLPKETRHDNQMGNMEVEINDNPEAIQASLVNAIEELREEVEEVEEGRLSPLGPLVDTRDVNGAVAGNQTPMEDVIMESVREDSPYLDDQELGHSDGRLQPFKSENQGGSISNIPGSESSDRFEIMEDIVDSANKQPFPTMDYLVNSCGLSPESALRAAQQLHIKTASKPDSVLKLFQNYGFTNTHIAELITKHPALLLAYPIKNLKPNMEFFRNNGISDPILAKILSADPTILRRSLENQIIPSFNYLKSLLHTNENFAFALGRASWILHSPQKLMGPNIAIL
ncbi:hypothetical protein HHK36_019527 [Tetracentron sinense]|uniref:Uncharacterized protein n=1 Tax=Tetracentron sinense TaxID=13715 RepID=A0A834YWH1_TETSI|nr:hypothetical protein HHK36_019527 [Tetracentron sinense]